MLAREREQNNAAGDTIIRLALAMWAADVRSTCTPAQRAWVVARLQSHTALNREERAKLHGPILTWYALAHPTTHAIVARQFAEGAYVSA